MPVQAVLHGGAAQPHGSPKPQQGLAAVYILLVSDKAKFKVPHRPGTLCFRLIQHRSRSDMGSLSSAGPGKEGRGWRRKEGGRSGWGPQCPHKHQPPVMLTQVCGCSSPFHVAQGKPMTRGKGLGSIATSWVTSCPL